MNSDPNQSTFKPASPLTAASQAPQPQQSQIVPPTLMSGLYWRRSLWNGAMTVPTILSLQDGVLQLKTDKKIIFQTPISTVSVRFTALKTMVVIVEGKKYALLGVGSAISKPFSFQQMTELQQGDINANTVTLRKDAIRGLNHFQLFQGTDMAIAFHNSLAVLEKWKELFTQFNVVIK